MQRHCVVCATPLPATAPRPGRPVVTCSPEHRAARNRDMRRRRYRKRVIHNPKISHRALHW
jgi:predicted nucleic acid-binding Zn ribbon protein